MVNLVGRSNVVTVDDSYRFSGALANSGPLQLGLSAGGPLESAAAATVIALTAWQNRQTF